jgi:replication fork clamp-binding protein CrfC
MAQLTTRAVTGSDLAVAARGVVDLGLSACTAYQRPDLGERLTLARRKLADPGIHIVIVGEFKQGKSSLVNALLGVPACPVDDDVATAIPTYLRYGPEVAAQLLLEGDPPVREPIETDQIRKYTLEGGQALEDGRRPVGVEVQLPRNMLSSGLVVVDTPGLGGLGSAHAAASLAATSMADAVLFVTDASQELTRTEVDFLRRARDLCGTVACVVTKTDFYPAWRTIRDLDSKHLARLGGDIPLMAVSSSLRSLAVKTNDAELNTESGFRDLVKYVTEDVGTGGSDRISKDAAREVVAVSEQLTAQFQSEQSALADPASAAKMINQLTAAKDEVSQLRASASRWNQTLGDGVADLTSDVDHDFRGRIRRVIADADDAIEASDPSDTWAQMEPWLTAQISYELVANYTYLRDRATELSQQVAEHFLAVSGEKMGELAIFNPTPLLAQSELEPEVKLETMSARKQTMVALRASYSGILMFTMLPGLIGLTGLAPIAIPIGLLMGRSNLRDEKKRQLTQRRAQAKNSVRRYCDEVQFVIGKDSRDTLRRIQRQLRDHYSARAEELNRTTTTALAAATEAAKRSQIDRESRLKDINAELGRLAQLRQRAELVRG